MQRHGAKAGGVLLADAPALERLLDEEHGSGDSGGSVGSQKYWLVAHKVLSWLLRLPPGLYALQYDAGGGCLVLWGAGGAASQG